MATSSRRKKKARVEKPDAMKYRKGVTSRVNPDGSVSWLVEMRFPKKIARNLKVYLGKYDTEQKAMIARDFVAFLRNSTGLEEFPAVGGYYIYNHRVDPTAIFEFVESSKIFDKLVTAEARCVEFKLLLGLYLQNEPNSQDARDEFVKRAKLDIDAAIRLFQSTYPEIFGEEFDGRELPMDNPVDGEAPATASSLPCGSRVPPTAGCKVDDGSTALKLEIAKTQLIKEVIALTVEDIQPAALDNLGVDNLIQALMNKSHQKQLHEKMLAELPPCTIDPNEYPPLE